ncbi:hypothetical protein Tco_0755081 [Tanacetum coccineum]
MVPVASKVGAATVASPAGLLKLDTHSSSKPDPSESSLPPIPVAPIVSPFLCSDDSELETEMPERHVSSTPHDAMVARWRSRVASRPSSPSRSSSPTTSTSEIPTAPIPPAPSATVAPPTIDIPIGRLYCTHPSGPCRALIARKSVRPLPSHRLALRYTSHHLDHFTSGSSSNHSSYDQPSEDHSLADHTSGHPTSDQSLSRYSSPSLHLGMRLRLWLQSHVLNTCFSSTLESSPSDSSATTLDRHSHLPPQSARPSRKSVEEDIDSDVLADIKADAVVDETIAMEVEAGIDVGIGMEVDVGVDKEDEDEEAESSDRGTIEVGVDVVAGIGILGGMLMPDAVELLEQVEEVVQDIYRHVIEIPLQRVEDIETGQRQLEAKILIASKERASLLDRVAALERSNTRLRDTLRRKSATANRLRQCIGFMADELRQICRFRYYDRLRFRRLEIMTITRSSMTLEAIEELINQRVAEALATYEANCDAELVVESQSQNGDDGDNKNGWGNGNGNGKGNGDEKSRGNGNENGGGNGNGNPNRNDRGAIPVARECTYHDFVKCQPLNFKRIEGVVRLTRWFEKMETVFHINNCPKRYQVKYGTCTMLNSALTWWNAHKRTIGADAAFTMSWRGLMKLMNEMVPEEEDRVRKFIGGLPDNIQVNVIVAEPMRLQDAIRIANNLMDQKLKGYAAKSIENKRRLDSNQKDNRVQQPPYKR